MIIRGSLNRIFADKEEKGFSQEVLTPLWQSLQNDDDDMDITFDDEIYAQSVIDFFGKYAGSLKISDNAEQEYNQHRVEKFKEIK